MRLELHIVKIQDIQFGNKTRINNGVLYISRGELQELLEGDKRLGKVDIEVARPGEKCRILQVADVIEPRAKIGSDSEDFLGSAGKHLTTGEGKTCVLRGAAIVMSDYRKKGELTISRDPRGDIIDMCGPGSEISAYGKTFNVVLLPQPKDRVSTLDYQAALKIAGLKTEAYLARAGKDLKQY